MPVPAFVAHPLPPAPRARPAQPARHRRRAPRASADPSPPVSRRAALLTLANLAALPALAPATTRAATAQSPTPQTESSHLVYLDVSVAGRARGRVVLQLDPTLAPASTATFEALATGTLRSRSGRTAGYRYSQAAHVLRGTRVELGKLNQIDALNQQPGTPQRLTPVVEVPLNNDANDVPHDRAGLVSVARGGAFAFSLLAAPDRALDATNLVVGKVVSGMEVVEQMVNVPTNKKTIRDGYRSVGKAIGDARANVDLENKPLQKIVITDCGLL